MPRPARTWPRPNAPLPSLTFHVPAGNQSESVARLKICDGRLQALRCFARRSLRTAADLEVTANLVEAGKVLGIDVLDHLIIAGNKFISVPLK